MTEKKKKHAGLPTQIKNPALVEQRRSQLIESAVKLFVKNGYHKTKMKEIAAATGFSTGLLYEYITSKEDVLYLVCTSIHDQVERGIKGAISRTKDSREALKEVIREYFLVCDRMSEHILLMYQVTQFLSKQWQEKVLENEIRITNLFINSISDILSNGGLPHLNNYSFEQIANNISVLGHQWAFRGWYLKRKQTIEGYIRFQTDFILGGCN